VLRPTDQGALDDLGYAYDVVSDGGFVSVVLKDVAMPSGIDPRVSSILLRLPPGFPDAAPDMFWLDPPVKGPAGRVIPGTESVQSFLGRTWQRWSRHIQHQWRPGVDSLGTYIAYVRHCLNQAAGRAA
jgi:hypothetical protein